MKPKFIRVAQGGNIKKILKRLPSSQHILKYFLWMIHAPPYTQNLYFGVFSSLNCLQKFIFLRFYHS